MDVTESSVYRDLRSAQQLLKDREAEHTAELDSIRDNQKDQIKDLEEIQSGNIKRLKKETDGQLKNARERFDESLTANSDSYEKRMAEERREAYDKFGRMATEATRERTKENEVRKRQVDDLLDSQKGDTVDVKKERETALARVRAGQEEDKKQLSTYFADKLQKQNQDAAESIAAAASHSRDEIDNNTRRKNDEIAKVKLGGELRFQQAVSNAESERDGIRRSLANREKQLQESANLNSMDAENKSAKAFEQYRERNSDQLIKAINDSNFVSSQKDRDAADRLARQQQEHQGKLQDMSYQYRMAENTLKHANEAERSRNAIKDEMKQRQHQQELYLNTDAIRKNNNLMSDIERQRVTDQLQDLSERHQIQMQDYQKTMQEAMNKQEMQGLDERQRLTQRQTQDNTEAAMRKAQEQHTIVRTYEQRQQALEGASKRQAEDLQRHFTESANVSQAATQKQVFQNTRENQEKLYNAQLELRNRTDEMTAERKAEGDIKDNSYNERMRRLTQTYNRNLLQQRDNFEETTENLKHENASRMAQFRGDSEHDKRMQLLDLQSRNRDLAIQSDAKLNQALEVHNSELDRVKQDNDKAMRDTVRKAKDTFETERTAHQRMLEAKDVQMKEKLKLQEETFKDQIEKLKRTHELSLKKS